MTWTAATPELYVISGIAFLMLAAAGLLAPVETDRSVIRHLPWLGAFGLLHGGRELFEAWVILHDLSSTAVRWAGTAATIFSYAAFFEFARRVAADRSWLPAKVPTWGMRRSALRIAVPIAVALAALMAWSDNPAAAGEIGVRVLLCLPAGIVSGIGMWRASGLSRTPARMLGAALVGFGVLGGLPLVAAPAGASTSFLTSERFTASVVVPVELLRALLALVAAWALALVVRRRAAARLAELEGEVSVARRTLESAQNAVAIGGLDGTLQYVNPAFVALWELQSAADAVGRPATGFWVTPEAAAGVMQALVKFGSWEGTLDARLPSGLVKRVAVASALLCDPSGAPTGMLGSFLDDSEGEALRQSWRSERAFSESLIDAVPVVLVVLTLDGRIERVNPFFEELTDYRLDAIRGADWFDTCLPPRDRARVRALFASAASGVPTRGNVNAIVTRDGVEREIEWSDALLHDAAGNPRAVLAAGVDVTDARRMAQRLAASEARLRAMVDAEPECVKVVDKVGRIVEMNPAGLRMLEAERPDQVVGRAVTEFIDPAYAESMQAALRIAFQGEDSSKSFEIVGLRGGRRWVEQNAVPLRDPADPLRVTGMLAVTRDVTGNRDAERRLQESESRLREAQAIGRLGSWELDLRTQRLLWSDEIYEIFGIDPKRFGASYEAFLNVIHPSDRDMVNEVYSRAVEERTPYQLVHRLLMPDGRVKWVEERARTWYDGTGDGGGAPVRSVGTVQDITQQVETDERLRRSLMEKETLLREIHHRVKNNLQIIASLLYFQSQKLRSPEDVPVFLEGRERLRAMILVHETLYQAGDLSRIAFAAYVRTLIAQLAESYGAARQGIRVTVVALGDLTLPIDLAVPCGMLLTELVINAFKHGFPNEASGEVQVRVANAGEAVELTVSDNGVGLPDGFDGIMTASFGWRLIVTLVDQIGGVYTFGEGPGTTVRVSFAMLPAEESAHAVVEIEGES